MPLFKKRLGNRHQHLYDVGPMQEFTEQELSHLMKLCRIDCSLEEKETLKDALSKVLSYIELLNEVDTEGVAPCTRVLETSGNVLRQDLTSQTLTREEFLANAPAHVGGMVRVPPVIQFSNP